MSRRLLSLVALLAAAAAIFGTGRSPASGVHTAYAGTKAATDITSTSAYLHGFFQCGGSFVVTDSAGVGKRYQAGSDGAVMLTRLTPDSPYSFFADSDCGRGQDRTFTTMARFTAAVVGDGAVSATATIDPGAPLPTVACPPTCTMDANPNATITAVAHPGATSVFGGWTGTCAGQGPTCTTTASGDLLATATFAAGHRVTVARSGDGSGTVTSAPGGIACGATCVFTYLAGTSVVLTATSEAGSSFARWTGACSGTQATCTVSATADVTVGAEFDVTRTVSVSVKGHGTVASAPTGVDCPSACSARFARGTSVTLSATAEDGWAFVTWSGACSGATACAVEVEAADVHVEALFRPLVALKVAKAGKGSGTITSVPSGIGCGKHCSKTFVAGTSVTLRARPAKGSRFDHWAGACARFKSAPSCTLTLTRASGVIAAFAPVRKG